MMMANKPPRLRRCTECKEYYQPIRYGLKILKQCGKECIKKAADKIREKEFDAVTRQMKKAANDKNPSFWSQKAQDKCNEYILIRDKGKPCISCGTTADVDYAAGHFIPRGRSAALRFDVRNIHRQCNNNCNRKNSGNYGPYRIALVKLYGEEIVSWLEISHPKPRYRIDDYKRIYADFQQMIKAIKNPEPLLVIEAL